MKEVFYEWVRNLVFYQLLTTIIVHMIPDEIYQKYLRFYLGLLFVVIAIQPVFQILNLSQEMDMRYVQELWDREYEEQKKELNLKTEQEVSEKNDEEIQ